MRMSDDERVDRFFREKQQLREMSSPTSETLAKTFIGVLKSLGTSERDGISDEKLKSATDITINKFGAGNREGLNFKYSESEESSPNPKEAYILNFVTIVANGIGYIARPIQAFIEKLREIFTSAINSRRIFK
jgi:hypothetical protein